MGYRGEIEEHEPWGDKGPETDYEDEEQEKQEKEEEQEKQEEEEDQEKQEEEEDQEKQEEEEDQPDPPDVLPPSRSRMSLQSRDSTRKFSYS
jgi:hypothetical protein